MIVSLLLIILLLRDIKKDYKEEKNVFSGINEELTGLSEQLGEFLGLTNKTKIIENKKSNFTEQVDKNKSIIPDPIKQIEEYEKKNN